MTTGNTTDWTPSSWKTRPAAQQPPYEDPGHLAEVVARLHQLPSIVSAGEVDRLREQLAEAAEGRRFVLQGGDCAERFQDCNEQSILRKLKILLQMSVVLTYGARRPVIRVARIAGQFAKPRSKDTEQVGGVELPSFRGDNVNDLAPDPRLRRPDPQRLERGYFSSATTLNYIRALVKGGFADLRSPEHWQLDFIPDTGVHAVYRQIADRIRDAIDYLESLDSVSGSLREVDVFTSHEGLILPYEEAMTRRDPDSGRYYNLGAHFLWIGERTRQLDGAHVEYFRGIANPIGVKVGPSTRADDLLKLIDQLNPRGEPGRLTLITRFGAQKIREGLPLLIRAVKSAGRPVMWSCDPMHGNTISTADGVKTRDFSHIAAEFSAAHEIHQGEGSVLGGVHFELTGDNVTECVGGAEGLGSADLKRAYETGCDPRLNYSQSIEMAFLITELLRRTRTPAAQTVKK